MSRIGIDEAGRGPVIGPLCIAGVSLNGEVAEKLKTAGVKDSKLLSNRRIAFLEKMIMENCNGFEVKMLSPSDIDDRFKDGKNLNFLELDVMCGIANELEGDTVIIDSPSANTKKIREYVKNKVKGKDIIAENYADRDFIEVSAASILAKACREREVAKIRRELNYDFGSGYSSDPKTKEFLRFLKEKGLLRDAKYSKYLRKSWMTMKTLENGDLHDFF